MRNFSAHSRSILTVCLLLIVLTACAPRPYPAAEEYSHPGFTAVKVAKAGDILVYIINDEFPCLVYQTINEGGMACDFGNQSGLMEALQ